MTETRFLWPTKALLPLKGKLDARKGPAVACAYVDKTRQRLAILTTQETMAVEKALQKIRQDASARLAERDRTLERLAAIRANRRDTEERDCLRAVLVSCEEAILAANETLTNTQALLGERLVHLEALIQERISLYVMGVHSSRELKAFVCPQPEALPALDACSAGHQTLDSELHRVAEELMLRKEAA